MSMLYLGDSTLIDFKMSLILILVLVLVLVLIMILTLTLIPILSLRYITEIATIRTMKSHQMECLLFPMRKYFLSLWMDIHCTVLIM
jgi:hypothetical protein